MYTTTIDQRFLHGLPCDPFFFFFYDNPSVTHARFVRGVRKLGFLARGGGVGGEGGGGPKRAKRGGKKGALSKSSTKAKS